MVTKLRTAHGLQGLCPEVQISMLDTVDSLRSHGLSSLIPLPQIIVCGDQSSGKSSVLESISGVPFPVHGSLCTRFPTELILRRTKSASIVISIVPHHARSEIMKAALHAFHAELTDFNELPSLIEQAKNAMDMQHAFSNDILRIEISGPDRPHLTIVDLPGLIHSENKYQSASDISLIQHLATRYMKQKRSIILAVVSAKNDYANQIVLKLARKADPHGMRTLGVITKPDTLNVGSESERSFLSLARNQEVAFRLGWHVLRNRDTERELWTLDERDAEESNFLSSGAWTSLAPECRGSTSLRARLSTVLVRQISRELPNLIREIEDLSIQCQESLDKLGMARTTSGEQKEYLIKISQSYQELIQNATAGTYTDPHFRESVTSDGYENRLRAVIQNRNREFAKNMTERGQRYNIIADGSNGAEARNDVLTREQYIEKIVSMIRKNRGTELAAAETIFSGIFQPHLKALQQNSLAKLSELLKLHEESHPITYDQRFIKDRETVLSQREEVRVGALLKEAFKPIYMDRETSVHASIDFSKLVQKLVKRPEFDVDHSAASDALDCLLAYYQTALSRFIDDVTVKVIETCVVGKLREIMDPMSIFKLDDVSTGRFAGETEKCRTTRKELKAKLEALQNGSNVALYAETVGEGGVDQDDDFFSDTGSEDFVSTGDIPPYKMKNGHRSPSPAPEEPTVEKLDDEWERLTTSRSRNDKKKMKKKKALLLEGA
ncbi:Interferon-induced GTP-binding protein Mx [Beauveria bassiana]|nr:Interferon-induced GTP-binding protein Mx [Beauveria bassiana]